MDTATYTIKRCTNAVDGYPARVVVAVEKSTNHRANGTDDMMERHLCCLTQNKLGCACGTEPIYWGWGQAEK